MMNEISEDLFEYERPAGRLQILLHRTNWRWVLAGVMTLALAIPFFIAHVSAPSDTDLALSLSQGLPDGDNDPALWKASLLSALPPAEHTSNTKKSKSSSQEAPSEYKISGRDPNSLNNITNLNGLSSACEGSSRLTSISLSNIYLDAAQFSSALQDCHHLQAISLVNVWLLGNFSRVYLPSLTEFTYVQNGDDKRDSYKSPETLKQTLFFDKTPADPSWSVEKDLLNLGVEISIWKAGTKLIDIQRKKGEIYLNVKYCESVLLNVQGSFDTLTLINCNVTSASVAVIPTTLKYLNIRNAVQRTPTLDELTQKLVNLEELYLWLTFHCNWPGYELYLNLSRLPSSLRKLGVNNVDTTYVSSSLSSSFITELTVGDYITDSTVAQGFSQIFKNLDRINVVNMSDPTPAAGYKILKKAIDMRVKTIAVVHLHRNYSTAIENEDEILQVETVLDNGGMRKSLVGCYLLELGSGGTYSVRELSEQEEHEVRYRGLGFDKMDLLDDYMKWDKL